MLPAGWGERKKPFCDTPEHPVLNKAWSQEKLVNKSYLAWKKRNTQLQPSLAILSQLRRKKETEKQMYNSHLVQRPRLKDLTTELQNASCPPTPHHHITKALCRNFFYLLPSCLVIKKKLQGILKGRNKTHTHTQTIWRGKESIKTRQFENGIIRSEI